MDIEVASDDEFVTGGGCVGRNDENWLRKVDNKMEDTKMEGWSIDVEQYELSFGQFQSIDEYSKEG